MRTGVPCNENRFFPVRIYYTGKTLFWPCTGPVRDCSACILFSQTLIVYQKILIRYISTLFCQCSVRRFVSTKLVICEPAISQKFPSEFLRCRKQTGFFFFTFFSANLDHYTSFQLQGAAACQLTAS